MYIIAAETLGKYQPQTKKSQPAWMTEGCNILVAFYLTYSQATASSRLRP